MNPVEQVPPPGSQPPTPSAPTPPKTPEQLGRMQQAVAAAVGGTDCVVCETIDGRFVTTERHCQDLDGRVVEKFYGPCPIIPDPPPPGGSAAALSPGVALIRCRVGSSEFHTTDENCAAWKGTVVTDSEDP